MLSISTNNFNQKPSSDEIKKISYIRRDVNIDEIVSHIKEGYVFSANFNEDYTTTITQSDRRYENFISTPMVMFDLDRGIDCSLNELIDRLEYKPTIAYTTFSHQQDGKGNRYRLLYLFQEPIEDKDMYKGIYQKIKESFNFKIEDNCGSNPCQAVFGSSSDSEVIVTESTYSVDNFDVSLSKGHSNSISKEKENNIEIESLFQNKEFEHDYYHFSFKQIINKYKDIYPFFEHTPFPITSDDCPYIVLPKNFITIKRYWFCELVKNEYNEEKYRYAKVRKVRDGEGRKRKLFLNGILRRKMIPNISFEHLLYCLTFELYNYYENSIDPIRKKKLIEIAISVMKADYEKYDFEQTDKRQFVVNDAYCSKYGISRRKARNLSKRLLLHEKIGELYDPTCTDKENVEEFKKYGLNICIKTLQRFRKDKGLMLYDKH